MDLGTTQPFTNTTQGVLDTEYVNNLYLVPLTTTRIIVLKIKHCLRAFLIAAKYKLILPKKHPQPPAFLLIRDFLTAKLSKTAAISQKFHMLKLDQCHWRKKKSQSK